ncbi:MULTISPECIES: cysteine--tRNA ligase [Thalassospira]|jgi:cysteinyl-tRNA synthetase|uniref:Cysteine--tRNA ligase n=1 Tax=Thalassospira xiamenensis TaxID=220697 RepID=A0ABR5Y1L0_9PROT|nr:MULTISPECIES: cysteine--tRNA ligase [Thalassospira]MAL30214.1 cysteine--tRNA ligase [Thalassospira sp.]MBR9778555.1 cysteine--tRNA ligase [Rhodospirillales bacterium]KZD03811.1 cysteine--tRNA ligase [Thalassospira xiamenensis]KZD03942.1 cysteine--tRNA ligase [Thalassospira xiamenensis]MBR9817986.1 cysteine--tRNA ligase [Rhodospirillales bacterium]|tara:strand:+ start:7257 stop:8636 length:1380 start_codon:yes stop_codon:yes gene_type:complete
MTKTTLRIYDTLSREKQVFEPIDANHVRLYVCGPTVYDYAHVGNARPVVVFDTLVRVLRHIYPNVTYVRNVTDVDDKINERARQSGEPISEITKRTHQAYLDDMGALNAAKPDIEPRATEHIAEMIAMCESLIEQGFAYAAEGHVLFSVGQYEEYGKLSRRDRKEMIAGARVEVAPYKKDPADFVLWKPSDYETPGWQSPWGRGRPGWHIECSAMSTRYLGENFDIHGGGSDLVFPHHENEIAQSCCANKGSSYAKYWMHNGHLMVEGEKMSKSLGNFVTVHELLESWPGEAIRLAMLGTHYHQPINWTEENLRQAKEALDRFYTALRQTTDIEPENTPVPESVLNALCDDLNTPLAIAEFHELVTELNKATKKYDKAEAKGRVLAAATLLGILENDPEAWFTGSADEDEAAEIDSLIQQRAEAKKNRDFTTADQIRNDLLARGILLEDFKEGTSWKRV